MPSKLDPKFELFIDNLFDELVNMTAEYLLTNNSTERNANITIPSFSELIGIPINLNEFLQDYENYNGQFNSSLNHIDDSIVEKILFKQNQYSKKTTTPIKTSPETTSTTQLTSNLISTVTIATSTFKFQTTIVTEANTTLITESTLISSTSVETTTTRQKSKATTKKQQQTTSKVQKQVSSMKNMTTTVNCQDLSDGDLVPDPNDCSSFYTCFRGKVIARRKCNHDLYFDVNLKVCNWPEEVSAFYSKLLMI